MSQQMSPEAAEELIQLGVPVMLGMGVATITGIASEAFTPLADDMHAQQELGRDITKLKAEISTLESADNLLQGQNSTNSAVQSREQQITELEVRHQEYGNVALNFIEAIGLPLALGGAIAVVGVKRALRKSTIWVKN